MKRFLLALTFLITPFACTFQAAPVSLEQDTKDLKVIPAFPSLESNTCFLRIVFPRPFENKRKNPVNVQLRVEGYTLGIPTQNERRSELFNHPEGQSIHVFIDNEPYLSYHQVIRDSAEEEKEFYDKLLSFAIPFNLKAGQHVIRAFPARSYGESLKGVGCYNAEIFYFQDRKKTNSLNIDLSKPYLTYNEPQGRYPIHESDPILLDFYLSNCDLSPEGYKVRLTINGDGTQILTQWTPYYIYGFSKGKHRIKLELLDKNNHLVPGYFNVTEREIIIE